MDKEYLSIKEFAECAGVSVQSIYKRLNGLNNPLNQYIKLVDNQKMLNIRALKEVYGIKVEQPIQPNHSTYSTFDSTQEALYEAVLKQIDILNQQLKEKDKQINEKDKQIEALQKVLDQEQHLHALAWQRVAELEDKQQEAMEQMQNVPEDADGSNQAEEKRWWEFWK